PGKPVLAATATGVIWAVWHYPLILRGYDFGDQGVPGAAVMVVSCILISFIFMWLVERTGSILASSMAHAAPNPVGGSLTVLWLGGAHQQIFPLYPGGRAWGPLLLVCLVRAALGRGRKAAPAEAPAASGTAA